MHGTRNVGLAVRCGGGRHSSKTIFVEPFVESIPANTQRHVDPTIGGSVRKLPLVGKSLPPSTLCSGDQPQVLERQRGLPKVGLNRGQLCPGQ